LLNIKIKEILVEAHNSVGKVEVYYALLCRAFGIICNKLNFEYSNKVCLQMAIKAVNNIAESNEIVPTLLIFGAYLRITNKDPPLTSTLQRA